MKRKNYFSYEGFKINFMLLENDILMINATDMAKVFNKNIRDFMILKETKDIINECLKTENSRDLGIENWENLYVTKQKTGTWMHRFLAKKFAEWLDPSFEVWIIITTDKIFFDYYREIEDANNEILIIEKILRIKKQELMSKFPQLSVLLDMEDKISTTDLQVVKAVRLLFLN